MITFDPWIAGAERCAECGTITARLDGDGCAKWCCHCGARLNGDYVDVAALKAQQPSAGVADERAAFEAWYSEHYYEGDESCTRQWLFREPCGNYRHEHASRDWRTWQARARFNPCRAQAVQICKLGMYGQAYDTPGTYRAYTYADQPGNVIAYRLGDCLRAAHCDGGGDFIDFGLALLRRLQDKGFGVFQIAAPSANSEQGEPDDWVCGNCGSNLQTRRDDAAPSAKKESGDE